jgi:uncharacterized protein (DUF305 family)
MPTANVPHILNRLLATLNRSFAMYLSYAMPYFSQRDEAARNVFDNIVADQKNYVKKLGEMIMEHHGRADMGDFPMVYTDSHDLSLEYLIREMTKLHQIDLRLIENAERELSAARDPGALALVQEILGNARGHLENLKQLVARQKNDNNSATLTIAG